MEKIISLKILSTQTVQWYNRSSLTNEIVSWKIEKDGNIISYDKEAAYNGESERDCEAKSSVRKMENEIERSFSTELYHFFFNITLSYFIFLQTITVLTNA